MNPELDTIQALLGFTSEARFVRYAHTHLRPWFTYLPARPGCTKRLRHPGQLTRRIIGHLARMSPSFTDDAWLVDPTAVDCGSSRETVKHSQLASPAFTPTSYDHRPLGTNNPGPIVKLGERDSG